MKRAIYFVGGIIFLLVFASCSKENLQPNNYKNAVSYEQAAVVGTPQNSPQPGCPHASGGHSDAVSEGSK